MHNGTKSTMINLKDHWTQPQSNLNPKNNQALSHPNQQSPNPTHPPNQPATYEPTQTKYFLLLLCQAALAEAQRLGGFYAALGFSQGANVAAALAAKQASREGRTGWEVHRTPGFEDWQIIWSKAWLVTCLCGMDVNMHIGVSVDPQNCLDTWRSWCGLYPQTSEYLVRSCEEPRTITSRNDIMSKNQTSNEQTDMTKHIHNHIQSPDFSLQKPTIDPHYDSKRPSRNKHDKPPNLPKPKTTF